jgi:hypothetical protein
MLSSFLIRPSDRGIVGLVSQAQQINAFLDFPSDRPCPWHLCWGLLHVLPDYMLLKWKLPWGI